MKKGLLEPKLETCFENDTLKYQFLKNNQLIAAKTRNTDRDMIYNFFKTKSQEHWKYFI